MPRANRHFLPGHVLHLTHRCHEKDFLFKFARDRSRYLHWLYEARKRFGLCILNYVVTSNHVHLLVKDTAEGGIARSMQLAAGRTAQDYNRRKERLGAFWEDRYHATAVETDRHLARCMVYVDLNMVRAGVVKHPSEWSHGGYNEIQKPPKRYAILDHESLRELFGFRSLEELAAARRGWVEEALKRGDLRREGRWTESVAVSGEAFVHATREKLGIKARGRHVTDADGSYELRESRAAYTAILGHENDALRLQNTYFWNDSDRKSGG